MAAVSILQLPAQHNWSQFRGPGGEGIASDGLNYPVKLSQEENLIWHSHINFGVSSPVIWGDYIFLTAHRSDSFEVIAYDRLIFSRDNDELS